MQFHSKPTRTKCRNEGLNASIIKNTFKEDRRYAYEAHSTGCLTSFLRISACLRIFATAPRNLTWHRSQHSSDQAPTWRIKLTTSAGLVFVARAYFSAFCVLPPAVLTRPRADLRTPPMSPRAYDVTADSKPCPASAARLGSLSLPSVEYWDEVSWICGANWGKGPYNIRKIESRSRVATLLWEW